MTNKNHRFSPLVTTQRPTDFINRKQVLTSLQGAGAWISAAAKSTGKTGKCHRNAMYHENGEVSWLYANSNTGELISALLDLSEVLEEPEYTAFAVDYASTLLDDTERGLYRGEHTEAHGLAWYWTDGGTYTGGYSMRMPHHFYRLYKATGEQRYLDACDWIGRTILSRQLPSGLVTVAWCPKEGWMEEPRIGSRYMYPLATFATLWKVTGNEAYRKAYERAWPAVLKIQNADGSFFQCVDPVSGEPVDRSIKYHFYAYIFNALEEAYLVTGDEEVAACAVRLADHLSGTFYYRHMVPYCAGVVGSPTDQTEADSSVQDSCAGLLWLYRLTGQAVYRDVAIKLLLEAFTHQLPLTAPEGWAGAVLRGVKPDLEQTLEGVPQNRLHLHFDPTLIARCDLWFIVNHIRACRRLLEELGE